MTLNSSQSNTDSDVDSIATDEEENLVVDENIKQNHSDNIAAVGDSTKEARTSQVMHSVAENYNREGKREVIANFHFINIKFINRRK